MSAPALALVVVGAATVTGWLFRIIDAIERPARRTSRRRAMAR